MVNFSSVELESESPTTRVWVLARSQSLSFEGDFDSRPYLGKCSESVQSRAEMFLLKACDACTDMGQLYSSVPIP